ncbi:hypothetical protein D3C85_1795180 [compost metagenome]
MTLLRLATLGAAVFEAATPKPNAGCMMKKGAITLTNPTTSAGTSVGLHIQASPFAPISTIAKTMPVT